MSFKLKTLTIALSAALISTTAFASNINGPAAQLVNKITQGRAKITKQFSSIGNLEGFVVAPSKGPGQKTIIYADKSGKYVIAGAVITANGENLSQVDFNKYVNSAVAPKIFTSAEKTNWVQVGKASAPHKAYILVEPNCIACHMLMKELKPMIDSGQLAVRLIIVAFMKPQSPGMAAAILQAKDPAKAFAADEKNFNVKTETGSIKPASDITAATKKKLQDNMAFMTKYRFVGTPVVSFKKADGSYGLVRGFLPGKAATDMVNSMSNSF